MALFVENQRDNVRYRKKKDVETKQDENES